MIIVKLTGGLGNQLFQYAFARSLARKHKVRLKLDIYSYESVDRNLTPREYELGQFNIQAELAKPREVWHLRNESRIGNFVSAIGARLFPFGLRRVKEEHFHFSPKMLRLPDNVYLDGYWQSERYFRDDAGLIRDELQFRTTMPGAEDRHVEKQIQQGTAIAVHVRRGDFVSSKNIYAIHGVCGLDYYREAIAYAADHIRNGKLFVFSDDPTWVKDNLKTGLPTSYVTHNSAKTAIQDFRLMTLCQHQIIANSTFSWWAAWLNANPTKIVIAPSRWFATDEFDTGDLLPEQWVRL